MDSCQFGGVEVDDGAGNDKNDSKTFVTTRSHFSDAALNKFAVRIIRDRLIRFWTTQKRLIELSVGWFLRMYAFNCLCARLT